MKPLPPPRPQLTFVIPRLRRGSYWEYEVECYMLGLFGKRWEDAGKPPE